MTRFSLYNKIPLNQQQRQSIFDKSKEIPAHLFFGNIIEVNQLKAKNKLSDIKISIKIK